jgi:hypothetical protein
MRRRALSRGRGVAVASIWMCAEELASGALVEVLTEYTVDPIIAFVVFPAGPAALDRRMRTLLYEAANVMLTRYKGQLKLKDWAFAIARRSTMRKARIALARRLAIIMHAMLRNETEFAPALGHQSTRQETASSSRRERRPREGADDGADSVASGKTMADCDFNQAAPHPAYPIKRLRARREHRHP